MVERNLKHACGHWKKHQLRGTFRTCGEQIAKERAKRCPTCVAVETAVAVAQAIMSEPRYGQQGLKPAA